MDKSLRQELVEAIELKELMERLLKNKDFEKYMDLWDNIAKSLVTNCSGKDVVTEKRVFDQMKAYSNILNMHDGLLMSGGLAQEQLNELNQEVGEV